jgi:hypothetical protein
MPIHRPFQTSPQPHAFLHRASSIHALSSTWSGLSSPADCAIYPRLPRSVHDPDPRRFPTFGAVARIHKRAQAEEWGCAKFNLHLNNGRTRRQGDQSCALGSDYWPLTVRLVRVEAEAQHE